MNVRGLDDKGNAANFCETEQIVRVGSKLYSFVMTRGSVPIFWEQIAHGSQNLYEGVNLTRTHEMTKGPFSTHFTDMVNDYKHVLAVDLLQDKRDREVLLTKEYYKQFYSSEQRQNGTLQFLHFDFHRFCKGGNFQALRVLINELTESMESFGAFSMDLGTGDVLT